ncbi:MAG TPA: rRNA maturation RNase YbeY [Candidatus Sulfotelmatobacter sp.]|nr:rRNA maturation RNase YbeY [Candidatus Sulfotelmatobacter sp.]
MPFAFEDALVIFEKKIAGLREEALGRFVLRARKAAGLQGAVNVLVTTSSAMRALNSQFRGKDKATDVLSFPTESDSRGRKRLAGEIAISADIAAHNAKRFGHSAALEIRVLVLHGILHLAGFDHERDNGAMARKEVKLRQALHLPLALIERSLDSGKGRIKA